MSADRFNLCGETYFRFAEPEWFDRNGEDINRVARRREIAAKEAAPRCENCRFASNKRNYEDHDCQRRAPVVRTVEHYHDIRKHVPVWPIMKSTDWCGDWEPKA